MLKRVLTALIRKFWSWSQLVSLMTHNYQSLAIPALCTPFIWKERKKGKKTPTTKQKKTQTQTKTNPRHSWNFVQFEVKPYEVMFGNFSWFLLLLLQTEDSSGLQYIIYNTKWR